MARSWKRWSMEVIQAENRCAFHTRRRQVAEFGGKWVVFAGAVALWQLVTVAAADPYFPTPVKIGETMVELWLSGPPSQLFLTEAVGQGASTVEEVSCATRAATGCGGCTDAVRRLVEEHAAAAV